MVPLLLPTFFYEEPEKEGGVRNLAFMADFAKARAEVRHAIGLQ
jgi:hypothetical protein